MTSRPWTGQASYESRHEPNRKCLGLNGQSGSETLIVLLPIWPNCVKLFSERGETFGWEEWGYCWRTYFVMCRLFSLLEGDTRALDNSITSVITWPSHVPCGLVIWLLIYSTVIVIWIVAMLLWNVGFMCLTWTLHNIRASSNFGLQIYRNIGISGTKI